MRNDKLQENLMKSLQNKLKKESFVDGEWKEDVYSKQIDKVLNNYPSAFKRLDNGQCFKYKNLYVELRPETTTDVNDVPEMDFAVFETEEDMNTDYEQNIGVGYFDISNPVEYWQYVSHYCDNLQPTKITEDRYDQPNITWILENYDWDVDICTKDQLGSDYYYRTLCTSVNDAEKFNYHSDYWGDANTYQEENVELMGMVEPYVDREVIVDFEDGTEKFKILGIAIDKQYNSLSHTCILAEDLGELKEESKEVKTESKYSGITCDSDELYGSTSNTEALDTLYDMANYFLDYASVIRKEPSVYIDNANKMSEFSEEIMNIADKIAEYWDNQQ